MSDVFLTRHTIQRYRERVADVPVSAIWAALDTPTVRIAIDFGARFVRLSGGQRIVLEKNRIVTILPRERCRGSLHRGNDCRPDDGEAHAQG